MSTHERATRIVEVQCRGCGALYSDWPNLASLWDEGACRDCANRSLYMAEHGITPVPTGAEMHDLWHSVYLALVARANELNAKGWREGLTMQEFRAYDRTDCLARKAFYRAESWWTRYLQGDA